MDDSTGHNRHRDPVGNTPRKDFFLMLLRRTHDFFAWLENKMEKSTAWLDREPTNSDDIEMQGDTK